MTVQRRPRPFDRFPPSIGASVYKSRLFCCGPAPTGLTLPGGPASPLSRSAPTLEPVRSAPVALSHKPLCSPARGEVPPSPTRPRPKTRPSLSIGLTTPLDTPTRPGPAQPSLRLTSDPGPAPPPKSWKAGAVVSWGGERRDPKFFCTRAPQQSPGRWPGGSYRPPPFLSRPLTAREWGSRTGMGTGLGGC